MQHLMPFIDTTITLSGNLSNDDAPALEELDRAFDALENAAADHPEKLKRMGSLREMHKLHAREILEMDDDTDSDSHGSSRGKSAQALVASKDESAKNAPQGGPSVFASKV